MSSFKFDTHMHLDLYKDRKATIDYIEKQQSYTIAVTNLPVLFEKYTKTYSDLKFIKFALGFHPELVFKYKEQLSNFISNIKNTRYIGEIGLDYSVKDAENRSAQQQIFKMIIDECNHAGGKILSVHSRRAVKEIINIIGNFNGKVILHWFTGTELELKKSITNGYYFSINHQMINSVTGNRLIKQIPLTQILIESDAPFTTGLKDEYRTGFIDMIILYLAEIHKMKKEDMSYQLKQNFINVTRN